MAELYFDALFLQIYDGERDRRLFGFANFLGLIAFLPFKANFGFEPFVSSLSEPSWGIARNGRGIKRATQRIQELLLLLAARIRALCALEAR